MTLEVIDNPFESSVQTSLDESTIRDIAPGLPDTKLNDLTSSAGEHNWVKQEGVNEKFLFDKRYLKLSTNISAELGPFSLDVYEQAKPIAEAAVLRTLNEGDKTGSFRGISANGGSQWDIRQLTPYTFGGSASDRVYSVNTDDEDNFDIAPGFGTANTDESASLEDDAQAALIFGFNANTNPRVVEGAQVAIDDGETRTAHEYYSHMNMGTLQAADAPTVEYIAPDDNFDINGSAVQEAETDFFPFGLDVNVASNLPDYGAQA